MKTKNIRLFSILVFLLIYVGVSFSLLTYYNSLLNSLREDTFHTLESIDEQQIYNFHSRLNQDIHTVKTYSNLTSMYQLGGAEGQIENYLLDLAENSNFELFGYTDLDGNIAVSNINTNIFEYLCFQYSLQGETSISRVPALNDVVGNQSPMIITTPLYSHENKNEIIGIFFGLYKTESLDNMLISSIDGNRSVAVITSDGDIVAKSDNSYLTNEMTNIKEYYNTQTFDFVEGDRADMIFNNLKENKKGYSVFAVNGVEKVLTYSISDVNNWSIVSVVDSQDLNIVSIKTIKLSAVLYFLITILFIALGTIVIVPYFKYAKKMEQIVYYDKLTNAPTEFKFKIDAEKYIAENKNKKKFIMVKFDVKNFRTINQISGYDVGDRILIAITNSLERITQGKYKRYAKYYNDNFLVMHEYLEESEIYDIKANFMAGMLDALSSDFGHDFEIISGIYFMTEDNCFDITSAIEKANIAHRKAKKLGIDTVVYDSTFLENEVKTKQLEDTMKIALKREDFKVYLQPKFNCEGTTVVGAEALVRWEDSVSGKTIFPNEFIPFFEENNFIQQLDMYMFEHVCQLMKSWEEQGIELIPISINISRNSFNIENLPELLDDISARYNIDHRYLEIEITENALSSDVDSIARSVEKLRDSGFKISMDDFSSKNSSLAFLSEIDVDTIKIDRLFVLNISINPKNALLVTETIDSLKNLGLEVVVEGIETTDQLEILKGTKCDIIQGYIFAKPMPSADVTELLKNRIDKTP